MQLCKAAIAGEGAATTLRMAPVTLLRRQDLATWEAMTTPAETGTGGGVDIEGGAELAARVPLDRYGVVPTPLYAGALPAALARAGRSLPAVLNNDDAMTRARHDA